MGRHKLPREVVAVPVFPEGIEPIQELSVGLVAMLPGVGGELLPMLPVGGRERRVGHGDISLTCPR